MKQLVTVFFFSIAMCYSNQSKADDILIPFGENLSGAPQWKYLGGGTNLYGTTWRNLTYNDASWVTSGSAFGFGASPGRNTDIPENATAGGGGIATARYPTMYFRKKVNISSANLALYTSMQLKTQFDDAIVVWINGVEAYRNNIGANPNYTAWATAAIANNGNDIFTESLATSLFVAGDNIIAVEIHQVNATSSDLFFDMELKALTSLPDVVLFPFGEGGGGTHAWKYRGGGVNLDAVSWKAASYAEPSWVTGNAALGYGSGQTRNTAIPENTTAGGGGAVNARYPTMYFRRKVTIADPSVHAAFRMEMKFDDAIIVYLNGEEVYRNNIAGGSNYNSWATGAITNNGTDIFTVLLSKSKFVAGVNTIAVEVHQASATSSDLYFDMQLTALNSTTTNVVRGPYLQLGSKTGITVRWRTDLPTTSRVTWGTTFGTYPNAAQDNEETTEHIVNITGLSPDTKYFYTIGTTTSVMEGTVNNFFTTLPPNNTSRKVRVLAFGDCGNNSTNQHNVRDAFTKYATTNNFTPDGWILLGDNGYYTGLDEEYTAGFFNVYKNSLLKNIKMYPSPGNHDYGNSSSMKHLRDIPYYKTFSTPASGELGGVPSGTHAYYSFDIGDIHFLSLDSYGREDGNTTHMYDTALGNAQADWIRADLAANTKRWTVAYFHHPPYTKTSHNSDTESDLIAIRERLMRILERNGVDMVIAGHAHGYERSYLLKNYYNTYASPLLDANFNVSNHTALGNFQNGKYDGTANSCAYSYNSGKNHHGTMYMVAGSAGQIGGSATGYPLDCMYYSNNTNGGSFYFEVDSNRLDAKFISYSGSGASVEPVIRDEFTIFKDVNKVHNISVSKNTPVTLNASWRGTYYWPNNGGATTKSITINNNTEGNFTYRVRDANNCIQDVFNLTITGTVPVTINSFTATLLTNIVSLDWSTSQESNNDFFTVERSNDGINYSVLGTVDGSGTTSSPKEYHLIDPMPMNGVNYYRLSQTDLDGVKKNIEVKRVTYNNPKNFIATVVNVGQETLNINISNVTGGMVNMKVIDMAGREVLNKNVNTAAGNSVETIHLQKGIYVLYLLNSIGDTITTKIISD